MNPVLHWGEGLFLFCLGGGLFVWICLEVVFFLEGKCLGFGFGVGGSVLVFLKPFTSICSKTNSLFPSL